jgi:hypothetical protein
MQIPTSAGMLANSVLPVTPTQGGLLSPVGETAGSASFAPVEAVSTASLSREIPTQRAQPDFAPENSGQASLNPQQNTPTANSGSEVVGGSASAGQPVSQNETSKDAIESGGKQSSNEQGDRAQREADQVQYRQEQQQQQDLKLVRSLSQRDAEVHAHESAHSAVGGQYAGSANYTYQRGPDGVNYAVGGEVSIDVGVIPGNPQATLEKMQLVQRAALAPAEPSSQDRKVAALAAQQANAARAELVSESRGSSSSDGATAAEKAEKAEATEPFVRSSQDSQERTNQAPEAESPSTGSNQNFQAANDRISKINEILVAISQNDISSATGQLLDDVV